MYINSDYSQQPKDGNNQMSIHIDKLVHILIILVSQKRNEALMHAMGSG